MDEIHNKSRNELPAWVNRVTVVVLTLTLLYLVVGIPDFHRTAEPDLTTDAVDPVHRFGWLALFAAAAPVAWATWRQTLQLLGRCWMLLLVYGLFGISVFWALDPDVSLRRFILSAMQVIQLAVLITGLRRAATLHVLIAGTCIFGAVADLVTLAVAPGYAMAEDGFAGLQLQKNQAGLMMMYGCLSGGTGWFLVQDRRLKWAIAGSVVMMTGLLVLTRSSTSQSVVFAAPFVLAAIIAVARQGKPVIWAVVSAILLAIVAAAFGYMTWCGITGTDPWLPMRGVTFTQRTDIWSFVVGEIEKRPWLGAGYSSFWAINPAVQPSLKSDDWFGTYAIINEAHNGYLDMLASNGIVGLVMVMLVVFRTFGVAGPALVRAEPAAVAWQTGRLAQPTAVFHMAVLTGLLIHNFTESNLFSSTSLLVSAFLIAAFDLEKWRIATERRGVARFPMPAPRRRVRPGGYAATGSDPGATTAAGALPRP